MLLIDFGSRHRRYCLLLLSSTDVDEELLTSRATHYGVSELVDPLLDYLQFRGETTEDQLPSWGEFQEFAEEYELTV